MQLYTVPITPNCRKVEAVVAHLGLELETRILDIAKGELKSADYLAVNPMGLVPALVDGDLKLWESHAIMTYLAELHQPNDLYPQDLKARADVDRWLCWSQGHFGRAVGTFLVERFLKPRLGRGETDPAAIERATTELERLAPILEARLAETGAFVCGSEVTLADFSLAATAGFWSLVEVPLGSYSAIRNWTARLDALPAWAATVPAIPMAA